MQKKLKDQWHKARGTNVQSVLAKLNPIIRGWANYFRTAVAKEVFSKLDNWMFYKADGYTRWTHPKKSKDWRHRKYWGRFHLDRLDYWAKRQARSAKALTFAKQKLAKRQKGRCPECGESLFNDEELQVHHLLARSKGGKDTYSNLALVHLLCHQQIHAKTVRAMRECQQFNDRELLTDESAVAQRSKQEEKTEPCCS